MGTLFALVLTVAMTNGDYQDLILGVYDTEAQCKREAQEQQIPPDCFPVEKIISADDQQPAVKM